MVADTEIQISGWWRRTSAATVPLPTAVGPARTARRERVTRLVADGELLEWAVVHKKARYGTPRRPVEQALADGRPALLEIDLQGARQVRATMPEALFVFLKPPSWEELVRRLTGRGTESEAERERRLATARTELEAEAEFDVTIVNHEVHAAAEQLVALMTVGEERPSLRPTDS